MTKVTRTKLSAKHPSKTELFMAVNQIKKQYVRGKELDYESVFLQHGFNLKDEGHCDLVKSYLIQNFEAYVWLMQEIIK